MKFHLYKHHLYAYILLIACLSNAYTAEYKFSQIELEELIIDEIEACLAHPNLIEGLKISQTPSTAIIVGAGTTGIESTLFAFNVLPRGSTIILLQNLAIASDRLKDLIIKSIPNSNDMHLIVSEELLLYEHDKIDTFLDQHRYFIKDTKLYIYTADSCPRFVPDKLPYKNVLQEIKKRSVATLISEYIDQVSTKESIIKVLLTSECSQERSNWRIPNQGPHQVAKVVGDELFKVSNKDQKNLSFVAVCGGMKTRKQRVSRWSEYQALQKINPIFKQMSFEDFFNKYSANDLLSMDSFGKLLRSIFIAASENRLENGVYNVYSPNLNPVFDYPVDTFVKHSPAEYLWPPLEEWVY